eukprot:5737330-Amphidinium_carterae.1
MFEALLWAISSSRGPALLSCCACVHFGRTCLPQDFHTKLKGHIQHIASERDPEKWNLCDSVAAKKNLPNRRHGAEC